MCNAIKKTVFNNGENGFLSFFYLIAVDELAKMLQKLWTVSGENEQKYKQNKQMTEVEIQLWLQLWDRTWTTGFYPKNKKLLLFSMYRIGWDRMG